MAKNNNKKIDGIIFGKLKISYATVKFIVLAIMITIGIVLLCYIFYPDRPKIDETTPNGTNIHIERKTNH